MEDELETVDSALQRNESSLNAFGTTWSEQLNRLATHVDLIGESLLAEGEEELTPAGGLLLENLASRTERIVTELPQQHKQMHAAVSNIGKEIDRVMTRDISGLIRNEKDLEGDAKSLRLANGLICDYLMGTGRPEVAEKMVKEASLGCRIDRYLDKKVDVESAMAELKQKNVFPAVEWLEKNSPDDRQLIFDLLKQHMIELILAEKQREALAFSSRLAGLGFDRELAHVMGSIVRRDRRTEKRYEKLFSPLAWPALEGRMAQCLSCTESDILQLVDTGTNALPSLVNLKQMLTRRSQQLFTSEELPVEIPIPKLVHSVFSCPILRQLGTESNPPMRLECGHVISRDALVKLTIRGNRLKCPYCPMETATSQAKIVYF